jgi:hypothetical protein
MKYIFVPGKTVRRRRKARFHEDHAGEEFVALLIACLNASRRANGESDLHPGALAIGIGDVRLCDQRPLSQLD